MKADLCIYYEDRDFGGAYCFSLALFRITLATDLMVLRTR